MTDKRDLELSPFRHQPARRPANSPSRGYVISPPSASAHRPASQPPEGLRFAARGAGSQDAAAVGGVATDGPVVAGGHQGCSLHRLIATVAQHVRRYPTENTARVGPKAKVS